MGLLAMRPGLGSYGQMVFTTWRVAAGFGETDIGRARLMRVRLGFDRTGSRMAAVIAFTKVIGDANHAAWPSLDRFVARCEQACGFREVDVRDEQTRFSIGLKAEQSAVGPHDG